MSGIRLLLIKQTLIPTHKVQETIIHVIDPHLPRLYPAPESHHLLGIDLDPPNLTIYHYSAFGHLPYDI
jgi:hypothetical protein